jgi:nucleoside-diphosphate-sugar epimerase
MKILITGSSGFLGNYLVDYLKRNNEVLTLSKKNSDFNFDLSSQIPFFNGEKFDLVIHAAGKAHKVPRNRLDIKNFYDSNYNGTINLLKAFNCGDLPSKLLFISTVSVYGLDEGLNISEEFSLNAKDAYGRSKILAENYVSNWCISNKIVLTIFRLPLLIGVNSKGNFRSMITAIKGRYYFNISNIFVKKSMVLAIDVAKYSIAASNVGGVYNLTVGFHPTFQDLSKKIALILKKKRPPEINFRIVFVLSLIGSLFGSLSPLNYSKFRKMTRDLTFNDNKARLAFGWEPSFVIDKIEF